MPVYKDNERNTWYASFSVSDWTGANKRIVKRGFKTKKDAQEFEKNTTLREKSSIDVTFKDFYVMYERDMKVRLRLNTWNNKEYVIKDKIMPYFKDLRMCDIDARTIRSWQNQMLTLKTRDGKPLSVVYLKTINNQLSAILNHAVRLYDLPSNPMHKSGSMGNKKSSVEIEFWTKEEYLKFAEYASYNLKTYYAFEVLYWCGLRIGELAALTKKDIDFKASVIKITKSYQRIEGQDIITPPKTYHGIRNVAIPKFLAEEMKEYLAMHHELGDDDQIFFVSKHSLRKALRTASKQAGLKSIKVHALRHSHVSLLIEMGYSPLAIAKRVGHESITITFTYAHLFPNKQQEMADGLENLRREDE